MSTVIKVSNTLKQSWTSNSVCQHGKNGPNNSNFIHCKQSKNYHTHMCNTTICNNFFLIDLSKCCQTCVHNSNQTYCSHKRCKIGTCVRKKRKIETQKSICSKFQQNPCQLDTSCCTSFDMSFGQPLVQRHKRDFNSKRKKKSKPQNIFTTFRKAHMSLQFIMSCSCSSLQKQKNWLHCLTSNLCVLNLQICCLYFSCTTSSLSNKQKHRNQRTFIQHIKAKNVKTCKTCKLKTFQTKKQSIKRLRMSVLSIPTTLNCQRHQNCSLQHHPKIQSIHSKFQRQALKTCPICTKSDCLLKRDSCIWNKTRPQTHALKQCSLTKKQSPETMSFSFISWKNPEKKSTSQRKLQNNRKKTFNRNFLKQCSSKDTKTSYQRPHFSSKKE